MEITIKIKDKPVCFHTDLSKLGDQSLGLLCYYKRDLRLFIADYPSKDSIKIESDKITTIICAPIRLVEHTQAVGRFEALRLYVHFMYTGIAAPRGFYVQSSARTYPEYDLKTLKGMGIPPLGPFLTRQVTHLVGCLLEQNGL